MQALFSSPEHIAGTPPDQMPPGVPRPIEDPPKHPEQPRPPVDDPRPDKPDRHVRRGAVVTGRAIRRAHCIFQ